MMIHRIARAGLIHGIGRAGPFGALLALLACGPAAGPDGTRPAAPVPSAAAALSALLPIDGAHAEAFRRSFDEAQDRPRYVAALSPT